MNRVWHIARKDLRRMAVPVALWLGFIIGSALMFSRVAEVPEHGATRWLEVMAVWAQLLVVMQMVIGFVLTGATMLEDPVVGTDAFWPTRPISNARLFAAKLVATLLLFVVAPALAMTCVWFGSGFQPREVTLAVVEFMIRQLPVTLFAVLVSGLVRGLAGFLFAAVCIVAVRFGVSALSAVVSNTANVSFPVGRSQFIVAQSVVAVGCIGVLAHQFLTRRRERSWMLLAGIWVLPLLVAQVWRRDIVTDRTPAPAPESALEAAAVNMTAIQLSGPIGAVLPTAAQRRHRGPTLTIVSRPQTPDGEFYLPARGRADISWPSGPRASVTLSQARSDLDAIVLAAASGEAWDDQLTTTFLLRRESEPWVTLRAGSANIAGEITFAIHRQRVLGEMSVQVGSMMRAGANQVRIVAIVANEDGTEGSVLIEERGAHHGASPISSMRVTTAPSLIEKRDAQLGWSGGVASQRSAALGSRRSVLDQFVLRLDDPRRDHVLHVKESGAVNLASRVIAARELTLPVGLSSGQLAAARLIKVRFEFQREVRRPLRLSEIQIVGDNTP